MRRVFVAATILVLAAAGTAKAGTIDLTLTGAGNNILANIYMGPYVASGDGGLIDIICDDFVSDSYIRESWTANVSTLADVSQTKFKDVVGYEEVAWLTTKLLDPTTTCPNPANCQGDIQFAIWQVFDPAGNPFSLLSGNNLSNANYWLTQARGQTFVPGQFSNFYIFTPTSTPPTCNGGPCPSSPPQEFVTLVPEPRSIELLGMGIALALLFRRQSAARETIS